MRLTLGHIRVMSDASRQRLDPALADVLADPRATARRPPAHVPLAKVRAAANEAMRRQPPGPDMWRTFEETVHGPGGELRLRFYQPHEEDPAHAILFIHGGGFTYGDLDTHDPQCRAIAALTGARVVAVDYRLAPEHRHPAALEDCTAAWELLTAAAPGGAGRRFAIVGDSAGAHLALALSLRLRSRPVGPSALGLFYPFLDPACDTLSARAMADGPVLSRDAMVWFWENYLGAERTCVDAELLNRDLSGLPVTHVALAGADPLFDEGLLLGEHLRSAGVQTRVRVYAGLPHGFLHVAAETSAAREALEAMARDLSTLLVG